ncbi:type VII secretion-associated serine protease mycosin [Streptantibioticus silvisoli]|uniref:Type VII secretion-associated serine protease mycosin n=1 Tax=Streptantibioticus silvisoli TaxID=2705255 RepID=A0ABT6W3M1_9ACTN|nr:type VII secretion-associated serine protease mycosin [Streptantibioticus silvisoli]MDI5965326.1 type VII secretion-associated serine protease mycosin [Streptantibioticus silvisoli]
MRATLRRLAVVPAALAVLACCPPVLADTGTKLAGDGECDLDAKVISGTPWSLQRVLLNQLWRAGTGKGVRVAVVDTGVDDHNPQLREAVDAALGHDFTGHGHGDGTDDTDGHGTEVAGIIAARPLAGTGFVGIAPGATIIPIRQTTDGSGVVAPLVAGINEAVTEHAKVINISQDATDPGVSLYNAVENAIAHGVVVVASSGNDGSGGVAHTTFPASYPGVLAVGATDRDDQPADFSQAGPFVGVAAPGVDMTSTVPGKGQCVDSGTSFSAPYVSGVAALIRGKHPGWTVRQVVAQIEETADRPGRGRTDALGWGVVDPVRALTDDTHPVDSAVPDPAPTGTERVRTAAFTVDDGPRQRAVHDAVYTLALAALAIALIAGAAVTVRDARRRGPGRRR